MRNAIIVILALLASPALGLEYGTASVDAGKPTPFDDGFYHGRLANGQKFDPYAMAAAHRTLPLGTIVSVTYKRQTIYVKLRPDFLKRIIDLTPEAADTLGLPGLGPVAVMVCTRHQGIMVCQ